MQVSGMSSTQIFPQRAVVYQQKLNLVREELCLHDHYRTNIEVWIGVLAACLPPLGPLIRRTPSPSQVASIVYRKLSIVPRRPSDVLPFSETALSDGKRSRKTSVRTVENVGPVVPLAVMHRSELSAAAMLVEVDQHL